MIKEHEIEDAIENLLRISAETGVKGFYRMSRKRLQIILNPCSKVPVIRSVPLGYLISSRYVNAILSQVVKSMMDQADAALKCKPIDNRICK